MALREDNAFAMLVDTTVTPKPVAGSRSATFNAAQALHRVSRKGTEAKGTNCGDAWRSSSRSMVDDIG
jgi:hypothetical protein